MTMQYTYGALVGTHADILAALDAVLGPHDESYAPCPGAPVGQPHEGKARWYGPFTRAHFPAGGGEVKVTVMAHADRHDHRPRTLAELARCPGIAQEVR